MNRNRTAAIIIFGIVVLIVFLAGISLLGGWGYGGRGAWGPGMMGPGMMGGWGVGPFGWIGMLFMWLVPIGLVGLVVLGVVWFLRGTSSGGGGVAPTTRACPHCGRATQADWQNCPYCGQALK